MKSVCLSHTLFVGFLAVSLLTCGVNPTNPAIDPGNANVELFMEQGSSLVITQGDVRRFGLRMDYTHHFERIALTSTCGILDTTIFPDTSKQHDTIYFSLHFTEPGECNLTVSGIYRNSTLKDRQNITEFYVKQEDPGVAFVTVPKSITTQTGKVDTLILTSKTKGSAVAQEYTVSSLPVLDQTQLSILPSASKDTVRILFKPAVADSYTVTVTATAQVPGALPVKATALVGVRVYGAVAPSRTDVPQTIVAGFADTLRFFVDNSTRPDKLTMKLVTDKPLDAAIFTILPSSADSILIAVAAGATAAAGTVKIGVSTSNGVITDTSWYPITFVDKESAFWNVAEVAVAASEGTLLRYDLRPYFVKPQSGSVTFTPDIGAVTADTFWQFTPPYGSAAQIKVVIMAKKDAASFGLSLMVTVTHGDTAHSVITTPVYKVTFSMDGGTPVVADQQVKQGEKATMPATAPIKTGYIFDGWYKDNALTTVFDFSNEIINAEKIVYAKWTPVYTITYHGNGNTAGSVPLSTTSNSNKQITIAVPGTLAKTGHTFYSWNTDSTGGGIDYQPGDKLIIATANVQLFARWTINAYQIMFNVQGGIAIDNKSVEHGDTITPPTTPVKRSYVFDGWFKDVECLQAWDFKTKITEPMTLYAKWVIRDVDGNVYTEVRIGSQVWMVENLKTTKFNDGTPIPFVRDSADWSNLSTPGYCWPNNDEYNKDVFGALYNWYVADSASPKKVAPDGWHVASDTEWTELEKYLKTKDSNVAKSLAAATADWEESTANGAIGNDLSKNNKSGFTALPNGSRSENGSFYDLRKLSDWWTSTKYFYEPDTDLAWNRSMYYENDYLYRHQYCFSRKNGFGIRCIRD